MNGSPKQKRSSPSPRRQAWEQQGRSAEVVRFSPARAVTSGGVSPADATTARYVRPLLADILDNSAQFSAFLTSKGSCFPSTALVPIESLWKQVSEVTHECQLKRAPTMAYNLHYLPVRNIDEHNTVEPKGCIQTTNTFFQNVKARGSIPCTSGRRFPRIKQAGRLPLPLFPFLSFPLLSAGSSRPHRELTRGSRPARRRHFCVWGEGGEPCDTRGSRSALPPPDYTRTASKTTDALCLHDADMSRTDPSARRPALPSPALQQGRGGKPRAEREGGREEGARCHHAATGAISFRAPRGGKSSPRLHCPRDPRGPRNTR